MKRKWIMTVLYVLLICAGIGLLCYDFFIKKELNTASYIRTAALILGAVLGIVKTGMPRRGKAKPRAVYRRDYGKHIGKAFQDMPREERRFFRALDDYQSGNSAGVVKKLSALSETCRGSAEQYPIQLFLGLAYDEQGDDPAAVAAYTKALMIRPTATAASNLGNSYMKQGNYEKAMEYYQRAVQIERDYAPGYSNIAHLLIRMAEYEDALDYALLAVAADHKLLAGLSAKAICYYMLGQQKEYEQAYREAVTAGYDGAKLKNYIRKLDASVD